MNAHCKRAKKNIAMAESADSKTALYREAAEEIEKAILQDNLNYRQVAEQIGKSRNYVDKLMQALSRSRDTKNSEFVIDWNSGSNKRADLAARPAIPARREDKVELATKLLADPKVVEQVLDSRTKAASTVRTAISRRNTEERQRDIAAAEERRQTTAMPIGSLFTRIAHMLDTWSNALMDVEDDLVEARDQFGAASVASALRAHAATCERLADRMQLDVDAFIEAGNRK